MGQGGRSRLRDSCAWLRHFCAATAPPAVPLTHALGRNNQTTKNEQNTKTRRDSHRDGQGKRSDRFQSAYAIKCGIVGFSVYRVRASLKEEFTDCDYIVRCCRHRTSDFNYPSFRKLSEMKTEPNKAMQTTPVAVTPRAVARVAPSTSVSDL